MPEIAGFEGEKIWRLRPFDRRLLHPGTVRRGRKKNQNKKFRQAKNGYPSSFFSVTKWFH
jgi:hypothetical protein